MTANGMGYFHRVRRLATERGGVARNAIVIAGGTVVAHLALLAASPIITRVYTPTAFGSLELFISFISIASMLATLRYDMAIVAAPRHRDAAYLVVVVLVVALPISALCAIVASIAAKHHYLGLDSLSPRMRAAIVPGACFMAWFAALRYWYVRKGRFGTISKLVVLQGIARVVAQIGFGLGGFRAAGLIMGELVGRLSGSAAAARAGFHEVKRLARAPGHRAYAVARRFYRYPLVMLPASVVDVLGLSLTVPLLAQLYGPEAAGYFALVQRTLSSPVGLIAASVGDAYYGRLAEHARDRPSECVPLFVKTGAVLVLFGAVLVFILHAFGLPLFIRVFGHQWRTAGELAVEMAPAVACLLVATTLSRSVAVFDAQRVNLVAAILNLITITACLVGAHTAHWSLEKAVFVLSVSQAVVYIIYTMMQLGTVMSGARRLEVNGR